MRKYVTYEDIKQSAFVIDPSHKSHNASGKYATIHHIVTEMCTFLLHGVSVTSGALWDIRLLHCGICEMDLLAKILYPKRWCDLRHKGGTAILGHWLSNEAKYVNNNLLTFQQIKSSKIKSDSDSSGSEDYDKNKD